jgi:uncharacterized protein (TIGR02246 family)
MTDEEAIIAEVQAFSDAWSRGDARLAASFYTEDGVRIGAAGDAQEGRAAIAAAYERLFHGPFENATVTQERGVVRMLTPDLAIWRGGMRIQPADGGRPILGAVVQVMQRVGDRWLILEGHPKLFPPGPGDRR